MLYFVMIEAANTPFHARFLILFIFTTGRVRV